MAISAHWGAAGGDGHACACGAHLDHDEHSWDYHLADAVLPLIHAERDKARAEVVERVEVELQNAEDGKGLVDEADDWWIEVAVVRAALNEAGRDD